MYLTPELDRRLAIKARQEGRSVAEVVREILNRSLALPNKDEPPAAYLLRLATQAGRGPKDLSTNLTDYLYGSKSPNYANEKKTVR